MSLITNQPPESHAFSSDKMSFLKGTGTTSTVRGYVSEISFSQSAQFCERMSRFLGHFAFSQNLAMYPVKRLFQHNGIVGLNVLKSGHQYGRFSEVQNKYGINRFCYIIIIRNMTIININVINIGILLFLWVLYAKQHVSGINSQFFI